MLHRTFLALPILAGALFASTAGAFAQTAPAAPAAAAPAASAAPQTWPAHHHHHKNRMLSALRQLNLSDDQKSKIKGFMTAFRDSRSSTTPETRAQLRGQIEGVLTPEQRTQFEAQMKPNPAANSGATS